MRERYENGDFPEGTELFSEAVDEAVENDADADEEAADE